MMALSISALFDAGSAAHTWGPGAVKPMPLDCVLVAGESGSAAPGVAGYTGSWSMSAPCRQCIGGGNDSGCCGTGPR